MTITKNIFASALILGATVAGCAADAAGPNDPDDPSNPGNPDDPDAPIPVDATGQYQMRSSFDIAANTPGKVGDVSRMIIDATDSGNDPAKWILDQIVGALPDGTVKSGLSFVSGAAATLINSQLVSIAPTFVLSMLEVGNDFGEVTTKFGVNETLNITKTGDTYTAVHTVVGAHFLIDGAETDLAFADFGTENIQVDNVAVTIDAAGRLQLADHKVNLQFGKILRIALDGAIIPQLVTIDPASPKTKLQQLLESQISCSAIGTKVGGIIPFISAQATTAITAACTAGLSAAANLVYNKINEIDASALEFSLAGTARITDTNNNHQLDTIETGEWTGTLSYAGTPAPLAAATFSGARE